MTRRCWPSCANRQWERKIHHLGMHGIAGAGRRRAAPAVIARPRTGPRWIFSAALTPTQEPDAGLLRRPQPRHRRRRHRGDGFRADAGVAAGSTGAPRRRSGFRLEYNPAPPFNSGSPDTAPPEILAVDEGEDRGFASAPRRDDRARCCSFCTKVKRRTPTKTAFKEKGRPVSRTAFPFLRQLHIDGPFGCFSSGGLSPSHILIGGRLHIGAVTKLYPDPTRSSVVSVR